MNELIQLFIYLSMSTVQNCVHWQINIDPTNCFPIIFPNKKNALYFAEHNDTFTLMLAFIT